jgi:flagella basal body P-ring formation protein FlgA
MPRTTLRTSTRSIARIAAWCAALAATTSVLGDSIVLRQKVRLDAADGAIRLRDIAHLDGEEVERLGDVQLARLEPGATIAITIDAVRAAVSAAGAKTGLIDFSGRDVLVQSAVQQPKLPASGHAQQVASPIVVEEQPNRFFVDDVRDERTPRGLIADMIATAHADVAAPLRITVDDADPALLSTVDPKLRYELLPLSSRTDDLVRVRIIARDGDAIVARRDLTARVELRAQVAIAAKPIRRGQTLGGAVEVAEMWITPSEHRLRPDLASIDTSTATGSIEKGDRISRSQIRRPAEIRKNDRIIVRREFGSYAVEIKAIAEEDGALGDVIDCVVVDRKDRQQRRSFQAVVAGPGVVVIR